VLVGIVVAQILASGTLLLLRGAPATLPADLEAPAARTPARDVDQGGPRVSAPIGPSVFLDRLSIRRRRD